MKNKKISFIEVDEKHEMGKAAVKFSNRFVGKSFVEFAHCLDCVAIITPHRRYAQLGEYVQKRALCQPKGDSIIDRFEHGITEIHFRDGSWMSIPKDEQLYIGLGLKNE